MINYNERRLGGDICVSVYSVTLNFMQRVITIKLEEVLNWHDCHMSCLELMISPPVW